MKRIRYRLYEHSIVLPWSEANESMAKSEADGKTYQIEDDGSNEPHLPTLAERLAVIELLFEKLKMFLPDSSR